MVEKEILLLRRARIMTKQSFQNRIRTGGSLVRRSKASTALDSSRGGAYDEIEFKPVTGVLTDTSIGIEDTKISKHFR